MTESNKNDETQAKEAKPFAAPGPDAAGQKPSKGRVVLFYGIDSNGQLEHPALITRVWDEETINVTVFPDNASPTTRTSVKLQNAGGRNHSTYWRWPPRV